MFSPRNSVRVVFLIARGWRGTSLPRVNIRKEIQRRRCWAFSVKARLQWALLWRINQKKRNTYGVVPRKTYTNPGLPNDSAGYPGLSKTQHLRRWNVYSIIWITLSRTRIHGGLRLESVTPMALKCSCHSMIDGNIRMNTCWIAPKKRNTYGVVPRTPYANPG